MVFHRAAVRYSNAVRLDLAGIATRVVTHIDGVAMQTL